MTIDAIFTKSFRDIMFSENDEWEPKATAVLFVIFWMIAFVSMFFSVWRFLLFLTRCVNMIYLELRKQSLSTKKE